MYEDADTLLRKVCTKFIEDFQKKTFVEDKKSMLKFRRMAVGIADGSFSLYLYGDADFPLKLAASLAISRKHIEKTTFWKMRLGPNQYAMTPGADTGMPKVDGAHAVARNMTEDDLVKMLDDVDVNDDLVDVQRQEIIDELLAQIAKNPDIKSRFRFSDRNMDLLGLK